MTLASLAFRALELAGVTALARRFSRHALILCYHNVVAERDTNARDPLGLHMPLATFARQMRWLARNYDVIPLTELVARVSNGASLRSLAAVTFDDGYGGVFEHAWPLLQDLGIPATVFVIAQAPGRDESYWWEDGKVLRAVSQSRLDNWLTAQRGDSVAIMQTLSHDGGSAPPPPISPCRRAAPWQIIAAAVKDGLQLGAHSMTHRSLPALDEQELHHEVVTSRDIIHQRTGVTPEFFAYPYGLWNARVRNAIGAAGYRAAFTLAFGHPMRDPFALPRLNVPASIPDPAFHAWTAGLRPRRDA